MKKEKWFRRARFSPDVIREAARIVEQSAAKKGAKKVSLHLTVLVRGATWTHESEDEYFADYRDGSADAVYQKEFDTTFQARLQIVGKDSVVEVKAPDRSTIEAAFDVFERNLSNARLAEPDPQPPPPVTIFIGHGRSPLWRDLKDHLHDKHSLEVVAYEIGARAGHTIRDILQDMLNKSSFAILVMTGDDQLSDGRLHPRLNVVHETGLFQGRLSFGKVLVLLEEDTEEFSNIQGIQQIRFAKGNIKETFGEVLATLRREFPERAP